MKPIHKILIANRGEIALRIMRTLREMNIRSVAVYSEADRNAPHVKAADEAYLLGPAPSRQSYLLMDKIIATALQCGADAIHPGYGFLSENSVFAELCAKNGIIFIGPSAEAISMMGSKLAAKDAVSRYNIPMVPGSDGAVSTLAEAQSIVRKTGFPVLIKASAGGGGKGMRIVWKEEELEEQLKRASSEAASSFGDGSVFIEKYITSPRHIEIQVLGDHHGNLVYLFERECSIQRRYQKVIEEAPSCILTPEIRRQMGEAAVLAAKSCNYTNAGTVEFIMDEEHNFYFLEMNTRLQVEHPVTECITGLDLVREQVRIAEGQPLSFRQEDLTIHGHAIELRVCAEDPSDNFLPSTGILTRYRRPNGPGIRVDDGIEEGSEVTVYYDPMIAKLIVHAGDRQQAIERMLRAISEYEITGVSTTLPFAEFVLKHEAFVSGNFDTHFIQKYYTADKLKKNIPEEIKEIAAALSGFLTSAPVTAANDDIEVKEELSPWTKRKHL